MEEAGLRITISADVREAILNLSNLTDATGELAVEGVGNITAINQALTELRAAKGDVGNVQDLGTLNRAIKDLSTEATRLGKAGTEGFDELGNKIKEVKPAAEASGNAVVNAANGIFGAVRKLAFVLPGIGVAGIFGLVGAGLLEAGKSLGIFGDDLFESSREVKKMEENAKELKKTLDGLKDAGDITLSATGSQEGNIARVQALAAAVRDSNNTYAERKRALEELKETNKSYFGDLTLEASSMAILADRVNKYSQALITEAIIKGQVEEIAKVSSELQKQVRVLDELSSAYGRQQDAVDKAVSASVRSGDSKIGVAGSSDVYDQEAALEQIKKKYLAQNEAVATLKTQISQYTDELNKNILVQLDERPLKEQKATKDELKSIIPILKEIQGIYEALAKPSKDPLHKQSEASGANLPDGTFSPEVQVIQAQIAEAVKKASESTSPSLASAYKKLGDALNAKLDDVLHPNLVSHIQPIADIDDKELRKFQEDTGKLLTERTSKLPAIKSDIKVDPNLVLQSLPIQELNKSIQKAVNGAPAKAFDGVGQAIGASLAKGANPIQAAGKSILTALGQVMEDIGKALIQYGVVKEGLDNVLTAGIALPGVAAIAIGIGAEAIGALIKGAGSSYHAFAAGGIVTGPTMGLIGEAGPEVIFPLDRLNQFVKSTSGNGRQNINVTGVIRGRDLAIVQARDSKLQNMTS
jgi:hypothetical protein